MRAGRHDAVTPPGRALEKFTRLAEMDPTGLQTCTVSAVLLITS